MRARTAACPRLNLLLPRNAERNELPVNRRQFLGALSVLALRLCQRHAHEQRIVLRRIRRGLPGTARGFEPAAPCQKLALGGDPFAQLVPAPEDRLMRHFRVGLAGLRVVAVTRQHDWDSRQVRRQAATPRRRTRRERRAVASARRPRARSRAQGENAAQLVLGVGMLGQERIGPIDQHAAKLDGIARQVAARRRQPSASCSSTCRRGVRQERQGAHVLGRFLRCPARDDVDSSLGLEAGAEQLRRRLTTSRNLRLAQRRHVDQAVAVKSGSSFCNSPKKSERRLIIVRRRGSDSACATISEKRRRSRSSART